MRPQKPLKYTVVVSASCTTVTYDEVLPTPDFTALPCAGYDQAAVLYSLIYQSRGMEDYKFAILAGLGKFLLQRDPVPVPSMHRQTYLLTNCTYIGKALP